MKKLIPIFDSRTLSIPIMKLMFAAIAITGLQSLGGCAALAKNPTAADAAQPTAPLKIIDAHVHTRFSGESDESSGITVTREGFVNEMKQAGVVGAVSHAPKDSTADLPDLGANGVIHCAGIGDSWNNANVEAGLKSGKFRCIKIYLGYTYRYAYDPLYKPVYLLAQKYDVPVVFHTGDTYSRDGKLKYADPLTIDEVAVENRGVRFVIAHIGNPWIESAAEVAYKNPNVYLDGSALLIGNLDSIPEEKLDQYVVKPLAWVFGYVEDPGKLMYGSDWPLTPMASYIRVFKKAIPKEHWNAVFHDNAAKVFKIKK